MESEAPSGFTQALKAILEERCLSLSTHPTYDELEVYHRGVLTAQQREEIAEHLAVCETCTLTLLYGVIGSKDTGDSIESPEEEMQMIWAQIRSHLRSGEPAGGRGVSEEAIASSIDDEIERLYDEIISLTHEEASGREAEDQEAAIERAYARLLELETAEAERHRQEFEARLNMPIDAGEQILAQMRALREELEDLAASNPAAESSDHP